MFRQLVRKLATQRFELPPRPTGGSPAFAIPGPAITIPNLAELRIFGCWYPGVRGNPRRSPRFEKSTYLATESFEVEGAREAIPDATIDPCVVAALGAAGALADLHADIDVIELVRKFPAEQGRWLASYPAWSI